MGRHVLLMLLASASSVPVDAEDAPVAVARSFIEAVLRGDVSTIRASHTSDALLIAGDVGGPLTGAEDALARPQLRRCSIERLILKPGHIDSKKR